MATGDPAKSDSRNSDRPGEPSGPAKSDSGNSDRPGEPSGPALPKPSGPAPPKPSGPAPPSSPLPRLEERVVGYSLRHPPDWKVKERVAATEFAAGARCTSVEVIDSEPAVESGGAASLLHSFVQVCARQLVDGSTLDEFMHQTYGASYSDTFTPTNVGGTLAYRAHMKDNDLIFLQTDEHRIQVAAAIVADAEKRPMRLDQVQQILNSFAVVK